MVEFMLGIVLGMTIFFEITFFYDNNKKMSIPRRRTRSFVLLTYFIKVPRHVATVYRIINQVMRRCNAYCYYRNTKTAAHKFINDRQCNWVIKRPV